jgi:hypothetical protein
VASSVWETKMSNIHTNLLGKCVKLNDLAGEICAVYQNGNTVYLGIIDTNGSLHFDITPANVTLGHALHKIEIYWDNPNNKIPAIKLYRQIKELMTRQLPGLKESKDFVNSGLENGLYRYVIDNINWEMAQEALRMAFNMGLTAKIL